MTLFQPKTPLHDGAVVITGSRIDAAKCILPLTENPVDPRLGTRHRAALGLSEESDALIIVVSEETRALSLALNGQLERDLSPDELRQTLVAEFRAKPKSALVAR